MAPLKKKHARNQAFSIPGGFTGIAGLIVCAAVLECLVYRAYLPIERVWLFRWPRQVMAVFCFLGCFAVLSLQFAPDSSAQHSLYVKEHKVRAEKSSPRPLDRTLFVLNIPPYCSEVRDVTERSRHGFFGKLTTNYESGC